VAKTVLHINAGKLTPYAGDYDYYLEKSKAVSARAALTSNGAMPTPALGNAQPAVKPRPDLLPEKKKPGLRETREARRVEADRRKMEAKAKREHETRLHALEQQILSLEGRQKELTAELEKPDTYNAGGAVMQLNRELLAVTEDLARVTEEWEGAALERDSFRLD
jgi:ATP-binding cassette, subfamily F, member 3